MLNLLKAPGYNKPEHFAMFISQWAHQLFLWDVISYERYISIQNRMYNP